MLQYTSDCKTNKLERMLLKSYVQEVVSDTNLCSKVWGETGDELAGCLRAIKLKCEATKKSSTGRMEDNFEFEMLHAEKTINIWHTKITTGERDELIAKITNK